MSYNESQKIQNINVKAGKLFCVSSGEYSDYGYQGHFLALVDISTDMFQEVVDESIEMEKKNDDWEYRADYCFLPNLIRRGWVVDVDVQEIHKGSYGELRLS